MKQFQPSRSPCPISRASRILGDRWVLLILREAFLGGTRFEGFMQRLPISRAALTSRLGLLVDAGLLRREPPGAKRARYSLTEAGRALLPLYQEMSRWSGKHLFDGEAPGEWPLSGDSSIQRHNPALMPPVGQCAQVIASHPANAVNQSHGPTRNRAGQRGQ